MTEQAHMETRCSWAKGKEPSRTTPEQRRESLGNAWVKAGENIRRREFADSPECRAFREPQGKAIYDFQRSKGNFEQAGWYARLAFYHLARSAVAMLRAWVEYPRFRRARKAAFRDERSNVEHSRRVCDNWMQMNRRTGISK